MRGYFVLLALSLLVWATQAEDTYSDKFDYVDVDEILANDRLREQYYKCFMETAPCMTADATFFKGNMFEAVVTKCSKCTEKQKIFLDKVADWFTKNQPEKWQAFIEKSLEDAKKKAI